MRRVLLLAGLLLCLTPVASAQLTFVQVQNNFSAGSSTSVAVSITNTSGNLLVAWVRHGTNNSSSITVSDSASETWTQVGANCNSTSSDLGAMWFIANPSTISSVTATFGASVNNQSIIVMEVSGADTTSPLDVNAGCTSNSGSVSSLNSASITTLTADTILIFGVNVGNNQSGASWLPGTNYTLPSNNDATGNSSTNTRGALEYRIVSSTTTQSTLISWSSSANAHGLFAAFKKASAGGAAPARHKILFSSLMRWPVCV